jgi:cyclic pyranopterin phosphate synthase
MLSHFDESGASRMVDVGSKPVTERFARAAARVRMHKTTLDLVRNANASKKGDVLEVSRLAGIMAAKRTSELIPLCHPLPLDSVTIDFSLGDDQTRKPARESKRRQSTRERAKQSKELRVAEEHDSVTITIEASVRCVARTGVEMEALTAAAVAALTIYDMCKSVDRSMVIEQLQLEEKLGGQSGHFRR